MMRMRTVSKLVVLVIFQLNLLARELGTVTYPSRASESPSGAASPPTVSASLARIHSRGYFALRGGLRSPAKRGRLCHTMTAAVLTIAADAAGAPVLA